MKIIDINISLGKRDSKGSLVKLPALLHVMEENRITEAVCYHEYALLDPKEGNCLMASLAGESGGKLQVCAVLDPILNEDCLPGEGSLLQRLQVFAPACLRIFPDKNRTVFTPFYWSEILEAANTLSLPLIIDKCGGDQYPKEFFARMPDIAAQYPKIKFILVGYGLCRDRHLLPLLRGRKNVYTSVEQLESYGQMEELCEKGCGSQLLFGSGWPLAPHAGALGLSFYADLSEEQRKGILYQNWEEIKG